MRPDLHVDHPQRGAPDVGEVRRHIHGLTSRFGTVVCDEHGAGPVLIGADDRHRATGVVEDAAADRAQQHPHHRPEPTSADDQQVRAPRDLLEDLARHAREQL